MRHPKQQFFLLLALSLGVSNSWTCSANSRDLSTGLLLEDASSRIRLETIQVKNVTGAHLISQQSSGILEMEPGSRRHRDFEEETPEEAQGEENPGASNTGESQEPAGDETVPNNLSAPTYRQESPSDVQQPIRQIEEAPTRIERHSDESQSQQQNLSNQSPVADEHAEAAAEKTKQSKVKIAKKKKVRGSKVTSEIQTAPPRALSQPPVQPPSPTSQTKSAGEEALLAKLVRELEFGTLANSISFLNQLVAKCPDDPDYKSLLTMALRLRDGDVWYQYQRKVDYKEPEVVKIPATIMKPTPNDNVNELKKSSWFLIRSVKR